MREMLCEPPGEQIPKRGKDSGSLAGQPGAKMQQTVPCIALSSDNRKTRLVTFALVL